MEPFVGQDALQIMGAIVLLGALFFLALKIGEIIWRIFWVALGLAALYFGLKYYGVDLSDFERTLRESGIIGKLQTVAEPLMEFLGGLLDKARSLLSQQ